MEKPRYKPPHESLEKIKPEEGFHRDALIKKLEELGKTVLDKGGEEDWDMEMLIYSLRKALESEDGLDSKPITNIIEAEKFLDSFSKELRKVFNNHFRK